ncbi:hypothetical protein OHA40_03910 [Nocardia sp. NBC_00508]|nr:hypothetical protein OHA40_03910 [Nocardia sp. NBC_00508]
MNFTIFDRKMVQAETITAQLTVTQPREVVLYEKAFTALIEQAAIGTTARELIRTAMDRYMASQRPHPIGPVDVGQRGAPAAGDS